MIFFFKYYYFNLFNIYISRDNEILTKTTYFLFNVKKKIHIFIEKEYYCVIRVSA